MTFSFFRRTPEEDRLRIILWDHYCGYNKEAWRGILRLARDVIDDEEDNNGEEISTNQSSEAPAYSYSTAEEGIEHGGEG